MPQVSVIILTYNPDPLKLRRTLSAAAAQRDVELEIIVSDDGSAKKDFSFLPEYMKALGVENYRLLEHSQNRGTVQSCLSAVNAATGEYVFLTSPGDYLYDETVLRDFYRFAKEQNAQLCFGNAVFYNAESGSPKLTRAYGSPASPQLYDVDSKMANAAFFGGCWVIGASYFRSRELMAACLEHISDTAKYMEDTTTTAFALAAGHRLCYYDRNVVWYEDGTGVSTGASEKWRKLLHQDALQSFTKLKAQYPKNPYVDIAYHNLAENNRLKRIAFKLLCHPVLMLQILRCKKAAKKPIACTDAQLQQLCSLLKTQKMR